MLAVIVGAALMAAAAPQAHSSADPVPQSPAWAEADANRSKMKTAPSFVDGPRAELPESEKALGHHGPVVVQGIIDVDGKMKEARVKTTSGAPALDRIALAAATASTFTPAKDANGAALPLVTSMPFDLVAYKLPGEMGILKYTCAQFVRDMDWWRSVNPDKTFKEHELYKMELGFEMLLLIQRAKGDPKNMNRSIDGFSDRWSAAIALCREKPAILQRDAIYR